MAETDPKPEVVTNAPDVEVKTGIAMHGDYPWNLRLRAEALARAEKGEDPDGLVTPELIADAGKRLEAENRDRAEAEAKAAAETPSMAWTRDKLAAYAEERGLAVESDANKSAILATIEAALPAAPGAESAPQPEA